MDATKQCLFSLKKCLQFDDNLTNSKTNYSSATSNEQFEFFLLTPKNKQYFQDYKSVACYFWTKQLEKRIFSYLDDEQVDIVTPAKKKTNFFNFKLGEVVKSFEKTQTNCKQQQKMQIQCPTIKIESLQILRVKQSELFIKRKSTKAQIQSK